jgi:hypothetical protein
MLKQNSLEDAEVAIIYGIYHSVLYGALLAVAGIVLVLQRL